MDESQKQTNRTIRLILYAGWACLLCSSACLFISIRTYGIDYQGSTAFYAVWLTVARLFGLGAFFAGVVAIACKNWTHGTLLFLGSVGLPAISLYIHGSL